HDHRVPGLRGAAPGPYPFTVRSGEFGTSNHRGGRLPMTRVSVIICTWNRARLLDMTLEHFARLRVPAGVEWELVVVNNNSTDDTDAVLQRHEGRLPLRRLFEPRPGKSFAANLALAEARSDLILWTDDDVHVDPDWLAEYVAAARAWPDASFFGGT